MKNPYRIKYLIFAIFIAVGLVFSFLIPSLETNKKKRCTVETTALVIDRVSDMSDEELYAPVYSYTIDGVKEQFQPSVYSNVCPDIGETVTIYVNPNDHSDIFDPARDNIFIWVFRIVGIVFFVIAFVLVFAIRGTPGQY